MSKFAHFILVKSAYRVKDYGELYNDEIVRWHGIPLSIISDRGAQFTSHFWRSFQKILGMQVKLSTAFHPQTDGQEEHTIQTLEDMFRVCVIDFRGMKWADLVNLSTITHMELCSLVFVERPTTKYILIASHLQV